MICIENPELNNIVPFLISNLLEKFNIYDILNSRLNSLEEFTIQHREIKRNDWKKIVFNTYSPNLIFNKTIFKKRVEKGLKLGVKSRIDPLRPYLLLPVWENIQNNLLKQIIYFYTKQNISKYSLYLFRQISFSLSLLQTLCNYLPEPEQKLIMSTIKLDSYNLQEKYFCNLIRLPLLIKIEPLQHEIKFETSAFNKILKNIANKPNQIIKNNSIDEEKKDNIFLYNPWDKDDSICYYWTVNSIQNILVHLFNPLNTDIQVNKLVIFFEGCKPFGFPVSTTIPAKSYQSIICKVKPLEVGLTDILGIRYEIANLGCVQYVDNSGNGLLYNLESFGTYRNQKIQMKNIQIYPEIPTIKV